VNHLDLDAQLAPQLGRHPGGMQPGDSVGAIAHGDPVHEGAVAPVPRVFEDLKRFLLGSGPEFLLANDRDSGRGGDVLVKSRSSMATIRDQMGHSSSNPLAHRW
jgi:hypothetical protein